MQCMRNFLLKILLLVLLYKLLPCLKMLTLRSKQLLWSVTPNWIFTTTILMINVSVIVPCFNEQETILQLLEAVNIQSYPLNEIEVIISDGLSTDHTREVISNFQLSNPNLTIRIIENAKRIIPSGLNRAIEIAQGNYIVRLDAHSIPDRDYIKKCINGLDKGMGDN